jgi:hypothetical protein
MTFLWNIYNASRFNSILFSRSDIKGSIGNNYIQRFSGIDPFGRSMIYYPAIKENKAVPIFTTGIFLFNDMNSSQAPNGHPH